MYTLSNRFTQIDGYVKKTILEMKKFVMFTNKFYLFFLKKYKLLTSGISYIQLLLAHSLYSTIVNFL